MIHPESRWNTSSNVLGSRTNIYIRSSSRETYLNVYLACDGSPVSGMVTRFTGMIRLFSVSLMILTSCLPMKLLVSASEDKRLIAHDVRYSPTGKPGSGAVATLTGHSSWVLSTDISPDGRFALSG